MKPIVIWGIGGHAREVAQLVADIEARHPHTWALQGFIADPDASTQHPKPLPGPRLGGLAWWLAHPDVLGVVAVGNPTLRRQIIERVLQANPQLGFATLVHPLAWVASSATLGQGCPSASRSTCQPQPGLFAQPRYGLGRLRQPRARRAPVRRRGDR